MAYITSADSDCGCVYAFADTPEYIEPKESGVLKVRYNTYPHKGEFIHPIKVKYNSKDPNELILLHIEGTVY